MPPRGRSAIGIESVLAAKSNRIIQSTHLASAIRITQSQPTATIHCRFEYIIPRATMPVVDEQTRRMARMLGATDEEILDDGADDEIISKSFYDGNGRMSMYVGLESDEQQELRTQK